MASRAGAEGGLGAAGRARGDHRLRARQSEPSTALYSLLGSPGRFPLRWLCLRWLSLRWLSLAGAEGGVGVAGRARGDHRLRARQARVKL